MMSFQRQQSHVATTPLDDSGNAFMRRFPMDERLLEIADAMACAQLHAIPWRRVGNSIFWAIGAEKTRNAIRAHFAPTAFKHRFFWVDQDLLDAMISKLVNTHLIDQAHNACPPQFSLRTIDFGDTQMFWVGALLTMVALMVINPILASSFVMIALAIVVMANTILRALAIVHHLFYKAETIPSEPPRIQKWPMISLLIPLYREPNMVPNLIRNLNALCYPRYALDIKIVVEADDIATIAAIERVTLPEHFEVIKVPFDHLRTKPKAMNYALPFCRGEIVGVYDAEDAPDPYQLNYVAQEFITQPRSMATVQCQLQFYNEHQNFLTRAFSIEYRMWFHMLLPCFEWLRIPVPLGGTSVFFRADVLREVGGWDAYNVTEDADLGIRLARLGYKTHVVKLATYEEANGRAISWIRQRSRWLKGYMVSWIVHMRAPRQLWRDLGATGFIGTQLLFLGGVASYLAIPFFWLIWFNYLGYDFLGINALPAILRNGFFTTMVVSTITSTIVAILALRRQRYHKLIPWVFLMIFYWPLGAAASYKALIELIFRPFYWDKTKHGMAVKANHVPYR